MRALDDGVYLVSIGHGLQSKPCILSPSFRRAQLPPRTGDRAGGWIGVLGSLAILSPLTVVGLARFGDLLQRTSSKQGRVRVRGGGVSIIKMQNNLLE